MNSPALEQLHILLKVTFDGDLISKDARDHLVKAGLVQRYNGWNWVTQKGVEYLENLRLLHP